VNGHLSWFRLWADAVDDEKLRLLAFEDRWHFVALLCCKAQGLLDEPGDLMARKVAVKLGLQLRELDEVARRLAEVGLIDQADFQPIAWDRRQYASDRSTERVRKFRERKQDETLQERSRNADETPMKRSRNAAETETETETEAEDTHPTLPEPKSAKLKPVWTLPPNIDPAAWAEFEGHRKEIQKPLTDRARSANAKILAAMSPADQRRSVEATIASRWTGLFPPKPNGANHADPYHRESDVEADHRVLADCEARARAHFPEMG
jgi:hypothetical protein